MISSKAAVVGSRPWHRPSRQRPPVKGPLGWPRRGFHLSKRRTLTLCLLWPPIYCFSLGFSLPTAVESAVRFVQQSTSFPWPRGGGGEVFGGREGRRKKLFFQSKEKFSSDCVPSAAFPPSPSEERPGSDGVRRSLYPSDDQWGNARTPLASDALCGCVSHVKMDADPLPLSRPIVGLLQRANGSHRLTLQPTFWHVDADVTGWASRR